MFSSLFYRIVLNNKRYSQKYIFQNLLEQNFFESTDGKQVLQHVLSIIAAADFSKYNISINWCLSCKKMTLNELLIWTKYPTLEKRPLTVWTKFVRDYPRIKLFLHWSQGFCVEPRVHRNTPLTAFVGKIGKWQGLSRLSRGNRGKS